MQILARGDGYTLFATTVPDGDMAVPREAANLAAAEQEYADRVRRLFALHGVLPKHLAFARLCHGAVVKNVDFVDAPHVFVNGVDGLTASSVGMMLAITGADCPPILLADRRTRSLALLHSGRRGTQANIAQAGLQALSATSQMRAQNVEAWVGPGICGEHYEVSEIDAAPFREYPDAVRHVQGRTTLDLRLAIREQLVRASVGSARVLDRCTYASPETWFSYRRATHEAQRTGTPLPDRPKVQLFAAYIHR